MAFKENTARTSSEKSARGHFADSEEPLHNISAEQCVIGGLLLKPDAWPAVRRLLSPSDFYDESHTLIFRAMQEMVEQGAPTDVVTVFDWLDRAGKSVEAGGYGGIAALANDTPNPSMAATYARIVRRKSLMRQRATAVDRGDHELAATLTAQIKALDAGPTTKPRLLTIAEVAARSTAHDWLIKGIIERQQTGVLWGESGTLKSFMAIDWACRIATGSDWNGRKVRQGAVLYIVGEGSGAGLTRRVNAWRIKNKNGIDLNDCPVIFREVPTTLPADTDALIADVRAFLEAHGWTLELVILDTLSRTLDGDENSQQDFGAYQRSLDQIRAEFGCAAMFIHHSGHADKTRSRGSSCIRANADVELSLEHAAGETVKLHSCKIKDAAKPDDMFFRAAVVELGTHDDDGKPDTSLVLIPVAAPPEATKAKLTQHEKTALGILESHGEMLIGDWRKLFYEATRESQPDITTNTLKISWNRAHKSLITRKALVDQDGNFVKVRSTEPVQPVQGNAVPITVPVHVPPNQPAQPVQSYPDQPVQTGTVPVHVPTVPPYQPVQTVHTPIGVYRCTDGCTDGDKQPVQESEPKQEPAVKRVHCVHCKGEGEWTEGDRTVLCLQCMGRGYQDVLNGARKTNEPVMRCFDTPEAYAAWKKASTEKEIPTPAADDLPSRSSLEEYTPRAAAPDLAQSDDEAPAYCDEQWAGLLSDSYTPPERAKPSLEDF